MAEITAALVKDLRQSTGAGMMDCKKALTECDGDTNAAVDWLRTKGLASAAKKAGRVASEGLVGLVTDGGKGAIVEINSETDFVARNEDFQELVGKVAELALGVDGDIEKLVSEGYPGESHGVVDQITKMIGTIGENLNLRRSAGLSVTSGVVASYIHGAIAPGMGKMGVLVALESDGDATKLEALGKQIAMHVAAANPQSVSTDDLDQALVEKERIVLSEQARESGKPEEIIEKMVEGRLRKFYEEVVLLSQTWVIDGETCVDKVLKSAEADVGAPIKIAGFIRFALGEGVEKAESDFAAEVAAAAQS
ncbi:MAG: elongation factor Ts [Rhodospirillales bacterium]|nr:elongation factor Ts [Rhodospirillales bacterium]